jgi:hypothetical protein
MLHLRPHHIIDIIRDLGQNKDFVPHKYGHDYHTVAKNIIGNPDQVVRLVISSDDICSPCIHLLPDKTCADMMPGNVYSESKQIYNDYIDTEIIRHFSFENNMKISVKDFLLCLAKNIDAFDKIYPHPKELIEQREAAFKEGLIKLGIIG